MVNMIRRALAGFVLLPGKEAEAAPRVPYVPEAVVYRACALRGYCNKEKRTRFLLLKGREESDVWRHLRNVVIEDEPPAKAGRYDEGLNLVVFRGVFGSGGYDVRVRAVTLEDHTLVVDCDFERPGDGLRTTVGFTQPAAIIPLRRLPEGKYHARLMVRELLRSSEGVAADGPSCESARLAFTVKD